MLARDRDDRLASPRPARPRSNRSAPPRTGRRRLEATANRTVVFAGFVNISGNPDDDWLGTGITETLTADAAQLEGVSVVPRERVSETLKTLRQHTDEPDERLFLQAAGPCGPDGS